MELSTAQLGDNEPLSLSSFYGPVEGRVSHPAVERTTAPDSDEHDYYTVSRRTESTLADREYPPELGGPQVTPPVLRSSTPPPLLVVPPLT